MQLQRYFIGQLVVVLCLLIGANFFIARMAANSVPRQLLSKINSKTSAKVVFLGNSTMAAAVDEQAIEDITPGTLTLNAALGASSPVEHLLLYQHLKDLNVEIVYYGFFDFQLTNVPIGNISELSGNRAMALYDDAEKSIQYYAADSWCNAIAIRAASKVPAIMERLSVWAKVERLRRSLGEIGMPKRSSNQFGSIQDFQLLESDPESFRRECELSTKDQVNIIGPLRELFQRAIESGQRITVVEMPMPSVHRNGRYDTPHWFAYRQFLKTKLAEWQIQYMDASEWIGDDGFSDNLHLNARGAWSFSSRLAKMDLQ